MDRPIHPKPERRKRIKLLFDLEDFSRLYENVNHLSFASDFVLELTFSFDTISLFIVQISVMDLSGRRC
jgi:hypothetical protein